MLKMIAFDFDGTLAPTIPMVIDVFRRSVAPYVEHELTKQAIVQTFGLNEVRIVKAVAGQRWPVALAAFYQRIRSRTFTGVSTVSGNRHTFRTVAAARDGASSDYG